MPVRVADEKTSKEGNRRRKTPEKNLGISFLSDQVKKLEKVEG